MFLGAKECVAVTRKAFLAERIDSSMHYTYGSFIKAMGLPIDLKKDKAGRHAQKNMEVRTRATPVCQITSHHTRTYPCAGF